MLLYCNIRSNVLWECGVLNVKFAIVFLKCLNLDVFYKRTLKKIACSFLENHSFMMARMLQIFMGDRDDHILSFKNIGNVT